MTFNNTGFGARLHPFPALPSNSGLDLINASVAGSTSTGRNGIVGGTVQLNNTGEPVNNIGSTASFTVAGTGTLLVTGPNNTGSASITVNNGGTLLVSGSGTLTNTPTLAASAGGSIQVNDTTGQSGRFGLTTNLVLGGGTFTYIGSNNAASTDALGTIPLASGNSTIATAPTERPPAYGGIHRQHSGAQRRSDRQFRRPWSGNVRQSSVVQHRAGHGRQQHQCAHRHFAPTPAGTASISQRTLPTASVSLMITRHRS